MKPHHTVPVYRYIISIVGIGYSSLMFTGTAFGQSSPDSLMKKTLVDTAVKKVADAAQKLTALSPETKLKNANALAKKSAGKIRDEISQRLGFTKELPISLNLSIGNALRYQPAPSMENLVTKRGFTDITTIKGAVQLMGVPLAVDFSTNQLSGYSPSGFNSNLFKFDFDPRQLSGLYMSDWQRFYDLRKNLLGGKDLSGYAQQLLQKNLSNVRQSLTNPALNSALSAYLANPRHIEELMKMDEEGIKRALLQPLKQQSVINEALLQQPQRLLYEKLKDQANYTDLLQQSLLKTGLLKDQKWLNKLQGLSKPEISRQLRLQFPKDSASNAFYVDILPGVSTSAIVAYAVAQKTTAESKFVDNISQQLADGKLTSTDLEKLLATSATMASLPTVTMTTVNEKNLEQTIDGDEALNEQIEKATATIIGFKQQLADQGYDVDKLLQVQQLAQRGVSASNLTETQANLLNHLPTSKLQRFVSKLNAFKLGSFSNEVPGSTQHQDLFVNGAHATFRLGYTPVTIGYGTQKDVQASKDAGYQSSVYNSPRSITYLGANFKGGWGGPLKVSIIGGVNKQYSYDTYRMPSISSNNVALTLTKNYRMGKLGNGVVEVSKTTTLYANNYTIANEVVLDRKAGLYNLNTDLFQSLSFSLNHDLEIKELGMTDRVYFSYAGMGYQNPGNNGFGGAQLKMGGFIKKAFYRNKLVFNIRSDLRTQPISYTSNDQWKSLQLQLDSRYQLSKKVNVALKYTRNTTDKRIDGNVSPVYSFNKMQADANASFKIGKNYSFSHLTVGGQQLANSYTTSASAASLIMVNYTQSLVIKQRTLTFNLFYNKELSNTQLIGNMLNSDFSYQFPLGKKITFNTGVTYLDNKGVARQAGLREAVQFASIGHFDIGSFIDVRKNLITPQYPDLYAATRAELTVTYHLSY